MHALARPLRPHARPFAGELRRIWRSALRDLFDDYRPELHYMRGPGPRWRRKHGQPQPGGPPTAG